MIEADPDANVVFRGELRQIEQLLDVARRRLLDEHVHPGADRRTRNLGLQVLRRGDDDRIDIGAIQQCAPVGAAGATITEGRDLLRPRQVRVNAMHQSGARQMLSPLSADYTAADDTDVQSPSPQAMPRSLGTMRRNV